MFLKHVGRHFQGGKKISHSVCLHGHKCWTLQTSGLVLTFNPERRSPRWHRERGLDKKGSSMLGLWATVHVFHTDPYTMQIKNSTRKKKKQKLRDHFPKYTCIPLVSILIRKRMLEHNQSLSVFQVWKDITLLPLSLPQSNLEVSSFFMNTYRCTCMCTHMDTRTHMYTHTCMYMWLQNSPTCIFYLYI